MAQTKPQTHGARQPQRKVLVRVTLLLALAAALLNASWAQGALVVGLRADDCPAELLIEARERVAGLLGSVLAQPLVGCLAKPALGVDVAYGQTRFAPLLPAVILLGPAGQNVDVIAHEWVHAELANRVGVLVRSWRLPTWFDEGLAMQVDQRPAYRWPAPAGVGIARPQLAQLTNAGQFFTGDTRLARARYGYARCVVAQWRQRAALDLSEWLAQRSLWQSFPAAQFNRVEGYCPGPDVEH